MAQGNFGDDVDPFAAWCFLATCRMLDAAQQQLGFVNFSLSFSVEKNFSLSDFTDRR